ncbi:hypothetical protein [Halobacterium litoreum]|uniref:Uncharacterized protein n=1 Tax=Halobacterium litoreum TaxID=2039234 RepID=A0ABD5NCZ8_9EURY|nr:hypothetical protein [Halobacterium litoreum]UHH13995.1 hypothetical protein LT972_03105 [Halobacterium litoreum]
MKRAHRFGLLVVIGVAVAAVGVVGAPSCQDTTSLLADSTDSTGGSVTALENVSANVRPTVEAAATSGRATLEPSHIGDLPGDVRVNGTRYALTVYDEGCRGDRQWFVVTFGGAMTAVLGFAGVVHATIGGFTAGARRY